MAPRANWKGVLKVGELTCAVALYTADSTSERIAFHTFNRKTGNRVRREFVDSETGRVAFHWEEWDGPAVVTPGSAGFGSKLIRSAFLATFEPRSESDFAADGLKFHLSFRSVASGADADQAA